MTYGGQNKEGDKFTASHSVPGLTFISGSVGAAWRGLVRNCTKTTLWILGFSWFGSFTDCFCLLGGAVDLCVHFACCSGTAWLDSICFLSLACTIW